MDDHSSNFERASGDPASTSLCLALSESGLFESEGDVIENFDTLVDLCRNHLTDLGFKRARHVMDIVVDIKAGEFRDDGQNPSSLHEVTQFIWLTSLIEDGLDIEDPEGAMINVFAHDMGEEFGMTPDDLKEIVSVKGQPMTADRLDAIAASHDALSKYYDNDKSQKKNNQIYFTAISLDRTASYVKVIDRLHNVISMAGVRDEVRAGSYLDSTEQEFISRIYNHSYDAFPDQKPIYDSVVGALNAAIEIVDSYYRVDSDFPSDDTVEAMMPARGFQNLPRGLHPLYLVADRARFLQPERFHDPDDSHPSDHASP